MPNTASECVNFAENGWLRELGLVFELELLNGRVIDRNGLAFVVLRVRQHSAGRDHFHLWFDFVGLASSVRPA